MKRSAAVILTTMTLTACAPEPERRSYDECQVQIEGKNLKCEKRQQASGSFVYVPVGSYGTYTGRPHPSTMRYGYTPGIARGGFGMVAAGHGAGG